MQTKVQPKQELKISQANSPIQRSCEVSTDVQEQKSCVYANLLYLILFKTLYKRLLRHKRACLKDSLSIKQELKLLLRY